MALQYIKGQTLDWGDAQWVKPLISLLLDGTMGVADYQCRQVLREHDHRLAPVFAPGTAIGRDEWRRVDDLVAFAETVEIGETVQWLTTVQWSDPTEGVPADSQSRGTDDRWCQLAHQQAVPYCPQSAHRRVVQSAGSRPSTAHPDPSGSRDALTR